MKKSFLLKAITLALAILLSLSFTVGCARTDDGKGRRNRSGRDDEESSESANEESSESANEEASESANEESSESANEESTAGDHETETPTESGTNQSGSESGTAAETEKNTGTASSGSETQTETETETEAPCGHEYENACSSTCIICGDERDLKNTHVYDQEHTCFNMSCTECGYTILQDHDWCYDDSSTATLLSAGTLVLKCSKCKDTQTEDVDMLDPALLGMPIVYITDLEDATIPLTKLKKADGEILVKYSYVSNSSEIQSFECISEIKVQGASSAGHPKKNYNVKFFTDETVSKKMKVDLGWGNENKYCMKANYIDASHARNIVGAQLFAQVIALRDNINEGLLNAPNYGLIDGYPILVYINGEFHGVYTMNIPKDDWTFAMEGGEESREAMLMADAWTNSVNLRENIGEGTWEDWGWELEHCSTADDTWVRDSFNELISLLNCDDPDRILAELPDHLDIEAAIDNMIYTFFINTADNVAKNILWATYDGKVWIPSMYDMDGSFGIYWNGQPIPVDSEDHNSTPRNTFPSFSSNGSMFLPGNKMYKILVQYYAAEVRARYVELRRTVFAFQNISNTFNAFFDKIPDVAYESDLEKWSKIPYATENRENMMLASKEQLLRLDAFFYNLD